MSGIESFLAFFIGVCCLCMAALFLRCKKRAFFALMGNVALGILIAVTVSAICKISSLLNANSCFLIGAFGAVGVFIFLIFNR